MHSSSRVVRPPSEDPPSDERRWARQQQQRVDGMSKANKTASIPVLEDHAGYCCTTLQHESKGTIREDVYFTCKLMFILRRTRNG